jgi:very-short-patch-repair endonuclease
MSHTAHSFARWSLLAERAAGMRAGPSWPERVLWSALRCRQIEGVQFRRQVVLLNRLICDFVAERERLVVEVDGPQHRARRHAARDARRDRTLERAGYRVVRIEAKLVTRELGRAVECVRAALDSR